MNEPIIFEPIKPWNGASGTGKDARLALDRNFRKIKEFLSLVAFGIFSDGSLEHIVFKTEDEYNDMPEHDPKTWYIITDDDQLASIGQILADLSTAIDKKADAAAVATSLQELLSILTGKANTSDLNAIVQTLSGKADLVDGKVPVEQLPEGSGVADGSVTPGKIAAGTLGGAFDWNDIFKKEGHWDIIDTSDAINRPLILSDLTNSPDTFFYTVITAGKFSSGKVTCFVVETGIILYVLQYLNGDVTYTQISSTNDLLNFIEYNYIDEVLPGKFVKHSIYNQGFVEADFDSFFYYAEEFSVILDPGEHLNGLTSFNFKVFDPCEEKIVQHQIKEQNIWERHYDMGTEIWSEWVLIAENQKKYVLNIDFTVATPFVYNVPQAMKFTSMAYEGTAPVLSIALNTNMARYNKLTITPSSIGLVTLTGTLL